MAKGATTNHVSEWKQYTANNEARNKANRQREQQRRNAGIVSATQRLQAGDIIVKINEKPVVVPETPTVVNRMTLETEYSYITCVMVKRNQKIIRIKEDRTKGIPAPELSKFNFSYSQKLGGIVVRQGADINADPKMELRWDVYRAKAVDNDGHVEVTKDEYGIIGKDLGELSAGHGEIVIAILNHSSGYRGSRLVYSKGFNPHMQIHTLRDPMSGYKDFYLMVKDQDWEWIPKRRLDSEEFEFPKEILDYLRDRAKPMRPTWGSMR